MRVLIGCILIFLPALIFPQIVLISNTADSLVLLERQNKTINNKSVSQSKWFKGRNIDFISSGLLRSSANIFVLNIGHPEKFHVPFYFLTGATTDILQSQSSLNEVLLSELLNEKGGFINFGIKGKSLLKKFSEHSRIYISYQLGAKSVTGINIQENKNESFLSIVLNIGFLFKTTAWSDEIPINKGTAWLKLYFSGSENSDEKMMNMFGPCIDNYIYGFNVEGGISLKDFLDISFGYYKYLNNTHIEIFHEGIFKFSTDF